MARDLTHFEFADRGPVDVTKFRFDGEDRCYVWFERPGEGGSLYTTPVPGPYRPEHPLEPAEHPDLDALLASRGTTRAQWLEDLMAQFGERIGWTYP